MSNEHEAGSTFADRVWPILDVAGRLEGLLRHRAQPFEAAARPRTAPRGWAPCRCPWRD